MGHLNKAPAKIQAPIKRGLGTFFFCNAETTAKHAPVQQTINPTSVTAKKDPSIPKGENAISKPHQKAVRGNKPALTANKYTPQLWAKESKMERERTPHSVWPNSFVPNQICQAIPGGLL